MTDPNNKVVFKVLFDEEKPSSHPITLSLLYSADDIKQAEITGYNQGFEQGHLEGFKQGEAKVIADNQMQMQKLIEGLTERISQLVNQDTSHIQQSAEKIILLTQTIIKKILPNLINTHGISEIEATIRHIFSTFLEKQTLLIHLNPEILSIISKSLEDITVKFGKVLNFEPSTTLGLYDCEIEWQGGGALWSQTCTLEKIEGLLMVSLNLITANKEPDEIDKTTSEETRIQIVEEVSEELSEETNE